MSALSEVDIRDWQRAEKIVENLPIADVDKFSGLPSWEDYNFLLSLIEKQLDGGRQVAALFKPPVGPWPAYLYEEYSPYNGM